MIKAKPKTVVLILAKISTEVEPTLVAFIGWLV